MNTLPRISTLLNSLSLSAIAYGVWRWTEASDTSIATNLKRIEHCLAQGISTFDLADIYGDYRSEALFGEVLKRHKHLRGRMEIVTKTDIMLLSKTWTNTRVKHYDTSAKHVTASVERSLQHMGVEVIDLLLIHRPDPLMDADELGDCLDQLIDSGKIRSAGVSNFMPWDLALLQSRMRHPLLTNQIELSLLHTEPLANGQLASAQQRRLATMAWSPLAGGKLMQSAMEPSSTSPKLTQKLDALAETHGVDRAAVACAWLLCHPTKIIPILGSTDPERIKKFSEAMKVSLDRQTWFELYELARGYEVA